MPTGYRPTFTANQMVALNLARARKLKGWTQERAAAELEAYLGTRWSTATMSQVERSVAGERIKQFSVDELVALSRTFDLPITWFLVPPRDEALSGLDAPDAGDHGHDLDVLVEALIGSSDGRPQYEQALREFSAAFGTIRGLVEAFRDSREEEVHRKLYLAFGDLTEAKIAITKLGAVLDELIFTEADKRLMEGASDDINQHEESGEDIE